MRAYYRGLLGGKYDRSAVISSKPISLPLGDNVLASYKIIVAAFHTGTDVNDNKVKVDMKLSSTTNQIDIVSKTFMESNSIGLYKPTEETLNNSGSVGDGYRIVISGNSVGSYNTTTEHHIVLGYLEILYN